MNVQLAALRKLAMGAEAPPRRQMGHARGGELALRDTGEKSLKAKRDRALLCLLVGAGLRREEVARLFASISS
jgi:site-specific recombinase XerC